MAGLPDFHEKVIVINKHEGLAKLYHRGSTKYEQSKIIEGQS